LKNDLKNPKPYPYGDYTQNPIKPPEMPKAKKSK
jgi:hypothetical protein